MVIMHQIPAKITKLANFFCGMEAFRLPVAEPPPLCLACSKYCNHQFPQQQTIQQYYTTGRRRLGLLSLTTSFSGLINFTNDASTCSSAPIKPEFLPIPDSGGVKALELRAGDGDVPVLGDKVAIHYYGRLAAKQGWRFDSTYDHKDETGEAIPFEFVLGSGKVISGIETAVKSMKVGSIWRVIIPPSEGYQSTSQEPLPPDYFDRQRLFTTIFNPTRLANGEGSTLGTLVFDIELLSLRHQQ